MKTKEITYKNFGKCLEIFADTSKVIVTLDFGPRIISYSFTDGENVFWEDTDRIISDEKTMEFYGDKWYLYGGHRLWVAPEEFPKTYYADNENVIYEIKDNEVSFYPPVQKLNRFLCSITVAIDQSSDDFIITHSLTNKSSKNIKLALWGVSVLSGGGIEVIPLPQENNIYSPNKLIAFWPKSKLYDKRIEWGDKYAFVRHDKNTEASLKFGINSEHAFSFYHNKESIFIKRFEHYKNAEYPDFGMSFETYTNKHYVEMESLGTYKNVSPGETITHKEHWALQKSSSLKGFDEDSIDSFINANILNR